MIKTPTVSKFGLLSSIFIIISSFIGRILFPFGDEPDFTVRAPRVVYGEHAWWSPYNIFHNLLANLNVISECKIDASRTSILGHIDTITCSESLEQILIRFTITLIIISPLLFAITFRKWFVLSVSILPLKLSVVNLNKRLDVLSVSLIFPGMIYFAGVFAEEQLTLILSLFIFLFWRSITLVVILIFLIMSIDLGNSIVVVFFVLVSLFFTYITKKFSIKTNFLLMASIIVFAYVINIYLLVYIQQFSLLNLKANAMVALLEQGDFINKYPLIIRPVMTFMTAIFMSPSGLKVIPLYIIYAILLIHFIYRIRKKYSFILKTKIYTEEIFFSKLMLLGTSITTVLFFVFLLPNYNNAKYYMFLLPFILWTSLDIYKKENILKIFLVSNLILFINLILYRL